MNKLNKSITGILVLVLFSALILASCSSGPAYVPPSSSSGAGSRAGVPEWVNRPNTNYPEAQYVVAVGDGRSLEEAQYKSKANLLQIFGMKLADEAVIAETFSQTTTNNSSNWNETISSNRRLTASAEGILVGCEIKETVQSGNTFYALATMEKPKAATSYNDIIKRLSAAIADALSIPNINSSIEGYARYLIAAELAKDVEACVNVLRFVGGNIPSGLKSEREYLNDARNILTSIPVRVDLSRGAEFDGERRIQNAFAKAIGDVGFRTGTSTSPYILDVSLNLSEANFPDNPNRFSRYEISANLINASTRQSVISVYSINGRSGHANYPEAMQAAIRDAERRINTEYKDLLEKSLAQF